MNKIPKFDDIAWNGGPEVDHRSTDWRARYSRRRGDPVRNTVAPVPKAPLVAPAVPVPTPSTANANQLNKRCRPKHNPCRHRRERSRLCRFHQG
jgi:hypothetical protein